MSIGVFSSVCDPSHARRISPPLELRHVLKSFCRSRLLFAEVNRPEMLGDELLDHLILSIGLDLAGHHTAAGVSP
jgi:hypothetical protein